MNNVSRVIVVDGLPETAEVLRAVLEPKGIAVSRCRRHQLPQCERTEPPPRLLIWHGEEQAPAIDQQESQQSGWSHIPRILICEDSVDVSSQPETDRPRHRALMHPFHYGELIAAIDRLLNEPSASNRTDRQQQVPQATEAQPQASRFRRAA